MELPRKRIPALLQDPKNMIIFGVPKVGKTTLLATLEDCLIIDLEDGSDYVDALKVKVKTYKELRDLCKAIKEAGCPYKFIAIDTVTSLETFAKPIALKLYKQSIAGKDFTGTDVTTAPHGQGWALVQQVFNSIVSMVSKVTPNIILVGHVKDKSVVNAQNQEIGNLKEFDLTGKTGRVLASKSDAIGFIFRDDDGNLSINFSAKEASAGARPRHLANQCIVIAERNRETGEFVSRWERIYPSLLKDGDEIPLNISNPMATEVKEDLRDVLADEPKEENKSEKKPVDESILSPKSTEQLLEEDDEEEEIDFGDDV